MSNTPEELAEARRGFHSQNGWYFCRMEKGVVRVTLVEFEIGKGAVAIKAQHFFPENIWASIICSVSEQGETGVRWGIARSFHGIP